MQDRAICLTLAAEPTAPAAEGKPAGFHGVPYSGGIAPNFGKWGNLVIDLASFKIPGRKSSMLLNHDPSKIAGRAQVANDGRRLTINDGTFSSITAAGKEVSGLMAEGQPWELSIGVNPSQIEHVDRKKTVTVNGQELTGVDTIFRNTRLLEVSFVPAGADPESYAAQLTARHGSTESGEDMPNEVNPLQARVDELTAQVVTLTAERDTARTELTAAQTAIATAATERRNERMTALFGAEPTLTDAQLAAYRGMSDEQFAAVEATLAAVQPASDNGLFRARPTGGRDHQDGGKTSPVVAPPGYDVDPERAQLHAKALQYQREHAGTDYLTAVSAVAN